MSSACSRAQSSLLEPPASTSRRLAPETRAQRTSLETSAGNGCLGLCARCGKRCSRGGSRPHNRWSATRLSCRLGGNPRALLSGYSRLQRRKRCRNGWWSICSADPAGVRDTRADMGRHIKGNENSRSRFAGCAVRNSGRSLGDRPRALGDTGLNRNRPPYRSSSREQYSAYAKRL